MLALAEDPRFGEVLGCATGFNVSGRLGSWGAPAAVCVRIRLRVRSRLRSRQRAWSAPAGAARLSKRTLTST